jgi:hypothetical protein
MYPFKVVPKKNSKPTLVPISVQNTMILPVANKEEYSCKTQVSIMAEVLLHNRTKVVEYIEKDLDDSPVTDIDFCFPSVASLLKSNNLIGSFVKTFEASIVDEYLELSRSIDGLFKVADTIDLVDCDTKSYGESGLLNPDDGADYIRERNTKFLTSCIDEEEVHSFSEEELRRENELTSWMDGESQDSISKFSSSDALQSFAEELIQNSEELSKFFRFRDRGKDKVKKKIAKNPGTEGGAPNTEYRYFEYKIEKLEQPQPVRSHKQSRDEHFEMEVSTKSDEGVEEQAVIAAAATVEVPEPVHIEAAAEEAVEVPAPEEVQPAMSAKAIKRKQKRLNRKKNKNQSNGIVEDNGQEDATSEPAQEQETIEVQRAQVHTQTNQRALVVNQTPDMNEDDSEEDEQIGTMDKEKAKLMEKLKQDSKDFLRNQLVKIATTENLDEYEKVCINEINAIESISKKMKQKARKRLRLEIEGEKSRRQQLQEQTEEFEDEDMEEDEIEEDQTAALEYWLANCEELRLSPSDLKSIGLARAHLLLGQSTSETYSGHLGQLSREWASRLKKSAANKRDARETINGKSRKWKDNLKASVERLDEELQRHHDKVQQADTLNTLFQSFKDSHVKSVLNILHEGKLALGETVTFERRKRVVSGLIQETRFIFKLPENSLLVEDMFQ